MTSVGRHQRFIIALSAAVDADDSGSGGTLIQTATITKSEMKQPYKCTKTKDDESDVVKTINLYQITGQCT